MAKTLTIIDRTALRQKGWKLFMAVFTLQILFLVAGYFISA